MDHNEASTLEYDQVAKALKTDLLTGLTSFESRERLKTYGQNSLDDGSDRNRVHKLVYHHILSYLSQFTNPLIQLLAVCAIVSAAIGEYYNAISILVAMILVCTVSYVQEFRADKSLQKLNKQMPKVCKVIRESQAHEIDTNHLVPGDVIYLTEGQRVPADVRLYDTLSMTVNESNLTGETQAQMKTSKAICKKFEPFLNLKSQKSISEPPTIDTEISYVHQNLALMGTLVESGHSRGVVFCTGKSTRYGQVFCMLKNTVHPRSPLQKNIDQLSLHLVVTACAVIAFLSILGIIQRRTVLEVSYHAISLAVTAIPEGFPVVVAVIMALGVIRLSKQKAIIKSLTSIETLGCVQVLCADKTGTLTRDDMTLTDIVTSELHSLSSGELEELNNEECRRYMTFNKFGGKLYSIGRLMEVGTLCNNASFNPTPTAGSESQYMGQATECAILEASIRMGFGDSRSRFDRLSEVPFDARTRRMVVQCERKDLPCNGPMYYVKGAWEEILNDCTHYYECGLIKQRTDEMWLEYSRICTALGTQGLRVLALATGPALDQLTFVGIVGINNSPRDGIVSVLSKIKRSYHIDVKMITGDCKATAVAVGRSLDLIEVSLEEEERVVMSGEQLQALLESDMDELAKAHEISSKSVFYRVDPVQKSNIVTKLQELDKIVAMTGDGVNDVLSLKKANLSLVMGHGADVCKEIADVILANDDLSVLIPAIIEGKGIYQKIHNFMSYQISISLTLINLIAISYVTRSPSPFTVIQLLFINILTDGPPAQALGVERISDIDLSPYPRNVHDPIINCQLLRVIFTLTTTLTTTNGILYYLVVSIKKQCFVLLVSIALY